jgi:Ca2+-binding RTX toxin-like protein
MNDIIGTSGNDTIDTVTPGASGGPATSGNDTIFGLAGNDIINSGGGVDTIEGGAGNDLINGQTGDDIAVYSGSWKDYTITGPVGGPYTITDTRPGSPDGTDTLTNVEFVRFGGIA